MAAFAVSSEVRMSTQTLVPSSDTTVHLVLNDFGYVGRAYIAEAKADEWTTVRDIANGEYSNPVQVIAFNVTEGWARDVTQHIAQLVLELCRQEDDFSQPAGNLSNALSTFLYSR